VTALLRLGYAELRAGLTVWLGVLAVSATAGLTTGLAVSPVVTATDTPGVAALALYGLSGTTLAFTAVAVGITVASVAELTLALLRRRLALWLLAGVTPAQTSAVALGQLVVVALVGAAAGAGLAVVAAPWLVGLAIADVAGLAGVRVHLGEVGAAVAAAAVLVLATISAVRPARRAGRIVGADPRRDAGTERTAMGKGRWALAIATVAALAAVAVGARGADDPETAVLLVAPLAATALVALAPTFAADGVRRWTGLVARQPAATWLLARAQTGELLRRSSGPLGPLVTVVALGGGIPAAHVAAGEAAGSRQPDASGASGLLLLLALPLFVTLVGSATTVVMSDRERTTDAAVALSVGATRAQVVTAGLAHVLIVVVSATAVGLLAVAATCAAAAWTFGPGSAVAGAPTALASVGVAAALCAVVQAAALLPAVARATRQRRHDDAPPPPQG